MSQPQPQTLTLRSPPYAYLHLSLLPSPSPSNPTPSSPPIDAPTLSLSLSSALTRFLGIHGSAIPFDILHVSPDAKNAWVRVDKEDEGAVVAAVGQWGGNREVGGVRVLERGAWVGGIGWDGEKDGGFGKG